MQGHSSVIIKSMVACLAVLGGAGLGGLAAGFLKHSAQRGSLVKSCVRKPSSITSRNGDAAISGIELAEKIKTGQFKTGKLGGRDATMTELWNAALAA